MRDTGTEHVITAREDGEIQAWTMDGGEMVGSFQIGAKVRKSCCLLVFKFKTRSLQWPPVL